MICKDLVESSRIRLRNLDVSDEFDAYLGWLSDKEINRFLEIRFEIPKNVADVKEYISLINDSNCEIIFGIFDKREDIHIGNIKLGPQRGSGRSFRSRIAIHKR